MLEAGPLSVLPGARGAAGVPGRRTRPVRSAPLRPLCVRPEPAGVLRSGRRIRAVRAGHRWATGGGPPCARPAVRGRVALPRADRPVERPARPARSRGRRGVLARQPAARRGAAPGARVLARRPVPGARPRERTGAGWRPSRATAPGPSTPSTCSTCSRGSDCCAAGRPTTSSRPSTAAASAGAASWPSRATGWSRPSRPCGSSTAGSGWRPRSSGGSRPGATAPGSCADIRPGDVISIHWDWACERLDERRLANLIAWTMHHLRLANTTI